MSTPSGTSSSFGRWTPVLAVNACGRVWEMERVADMESLWEAMTEFNEDEHLPYWTEIWPSSLALAAWLRERQNSIRGRVCLDMGCGIGLTALAGQWLGARVLAMDYEKDALRFALKNAERNNVAQPGWTVMDWRRPALRRGSVSRIWAGDIMYERRFASPILDFLNHALADDGLAWIAEPCRSVYDAFRALVTASGWGCRCVRETSVTALYPQEKPVPVRIWEIAR